MSQDHEEPGVRSPTGSGSRPKSRAADGAAAAYLEDGLGWLRGYPEGPALPNRALARTQAGTPTSKQSASQANDTLADTWTVPWRARWRGPSWHSFPVDRELLRTSFYTLRGARRKFPRALPRVVQDIDAWEAAVEARLRHIQAAVHGGEPLLPDPRPGSIPGQVELDWIKAAPGPAKGQPTGRLTSLGPWRSGLAGATEALGVQGATRLAVEIISDSGTSDSNLDALADAHRLLCHPSAFAIRTVADGAMQALATLAALSPPGKRKKRAREAPLQKRVPWQGSAFVPTLPKESLGAELVEFLASERNPQLRRLVLASIDTPSVDQWAAWWPAVAQLHKNAAKPNESRAAVLAIADEAKRLVAGAPTPVSVPSLQLDLGLAVAARTPDAISATLQLTTELEVVSAAPPQGPAGVAPGATSSLIASATRRLWDLSDRRRASLLEGLNARLAAPAARALAPDVRHLAARVVCETVLEFDWNAEDVPWEHRSAVLDAVLLMCHAQSSDSVSLAKYCDNWRFSGAFEGFAVEARDAKHLAALLCAEHDGSTWHAATLGARFACELAHRTTPQGQGATPDFELVATLGSATHWATWTAQADRDAEGLDILQKASRKGPMRRHLREAAAAGIAPVDLVHFARLIKQGQHSLEVLGTLNDGIARPQGEVQADLETLAQWLPESLCPAAQRLLTHGSKGAVTKALAPELKDPSELLNQVEALSNELQGGQLTVPKRAAMEARRTMLTRRLAEEPSPCSADLARWSSNLDRAALRARFRGQLKGLEAAAVATIPAKALATIDVASDRQGLAVLAGLRALSSKQRDVAYALLERRAGPRPWDLLDAAENVQWLESAQSHGLDLTRWHALTPFEVGVAIDAEGPKQHGDQQHGDLVFALEDDPLEVMKMGLWFGTCLSPHQMNFFSTIANAADANKRVLVGRDSRGVAQVRCLLAITQAWHLLSFHVYAHERGDWARATVRGIVAELATGLGTTPAPRGVVPTLVASDWYDDGAEDLTGQLALLAPGAPLELELRSAPASAACTLITAALGETVAAAALEFILGMPILASCPDRTASFGPVLTGRRWPRSLTIRLIARLAKTHAVLARELLRQLPRGRRLSQASFEWGCECELVRALRELGEPGRAWRLLQASESSYDAAAFQRELALTHAALGRHARASQIWDSLAAAGDEAALAHKRSRDPSR